MGMPWISFNGELSSDYDVVIRALPQLASPEERSKEVVIPGRDGHLTLLEDANAGFDLRVECTMLDYSQRASVFKWLRGSGLLISSEMPTRAYRARVASKIDPERVVPSVKNFVVTFRCQPYLYEATPEVIQAFGTEMENLVPNGNFSDGTTGWEAQGATISAAGGKLSLQGDGTSAYPTVNADIGAKVAGHKYYLAADVKVTNNVSTVIDFAVEDAIPPKIAPTQNQKYRMTGIIVAASDYGYLSIDHGYASAGAANGKVLEIENVVIIDLSKRFGSTVPGVQYMTDLLAAKYEGTSFFDGVAAIDTIYDVESVTNPGTVESLPKIRVYGEGVLTIGTYELTIEATEGEDYVDIDSELEECYYGSTSRNSKVTGGFPRLPVGASALTIGTGITKVEITGNWRWY